MQAVIGALMMKQSKIIKDPQRIREQCATIIPFTTAGFGHVKCTQHATDCIRQIFMTLSAHGHAPPADKADYGASVQEPHATLQETDSAGMGAHTLMFLQPPKHVTG